MVGSWLKYMLRRKSRYKVHSPFVYDFMCKVLNDSAICALIRDVIPSL